MIPKSPSQLQKSSTPPAAPLEPSPF